MSNAVAQPSTVTLVLTSCFGGALRVVENCTLGWIVTAHHKMHKSPCAVCPPGIFQCHTRGGFLPFLRSNGYWLKVLTEVCQHSNWDRKPQRFLAKECCSSRRGQANCHIWDQEGCLPHHWISMDYEGFCFPVVVGDTALFWISRVYFK